MSKTNQGNFLEDFRLGQVIRHATPRTVTEGDVALYTALYGSRFAPQSSAKFASAIGLAEKGRAPIDDLLAFHIVFGKTVPDISLNAVANLGYAAGRFGVQVFPGDTLSAVSTVIGIKENSNRQTGVVYVRTTGLNQRGETVLDYIRWVMVRKRDPNAVLAETLVPDLPTAVAAGDLILPTELQLDRYDAVLAGSPYLWDDYSPGEKIDHVDGSTIEEAEHMMATRLWQNTARVHFNQFTEGKGRFGRRLIYGGHIISLARALSFNGLGNAFKLVAINGGRHANPTFAGDTIFAWSEVLQRIEIPGRDDVGALRLRLVATRDCPCGDFPLFAENGHDIDPAVVLDFDYTVLIPRRRG
ncbi:MaoC family dehydratase [Magnetospirillum molischianum]|uniref:Acyl dehydratase n=1 Tax=Magnetospirillum molischianum DSM 120 TaxID=1150626 RepID=H8FTG0_MAGML|nr:MaoC family dehydratase [Magnetospirillum molischianum]CCG41648.1 Acyl dehydratase [Magnetospirillum molischianum DSM 120]